MVDQSLILIISWFNLGLQAAFISPRCSQAVACHLQLCHPRCEKHGQCVNGSCICQQGWNGRHCSLEGCGQGCGGHGTCRHQGAGWACSCHDGWGGDTCQRRQETDCQDEIDNDKGESLLTFFSLSLSLSLTRLPLFSFSPLINRLKNIQSLQFNLAKV